MLQSTFTPSDFDVLDGAFVLELAAWPEASPVDGGSPVGRLGFSSPYGLAASVRAAGSGVGRMPWTERTADGARSYTTLVIVSQCTV